MPIESELEVAMNSFRVGISSIMFETSNEPDARCLSESLNLQAKPKAKPKAISLLVKFRSENLAELVENLK